MSLPADLVSFRTANSPESWAGGCQGSCRFGGGNYPDTGGDYLQTTFVKERRTPFEWRYPVHFVSRVSVKLPTGATAESTQVLDQKGQSDFCDWQLKVIPAGKDGTTDPELRFEFSAKTGEHPAARYAAFHDAWEEARRAWDKPLTWTEK